MPAASRCRGGDGGRRPGAPGGCGTRTGPRFGPQDRSADRYSRVALGPPCGCPCSPEAWLCGRVAADGARQVDVPAHRRLLVAGFVAQRDASRPPSSGHRRRRVGIAPNDPHPVAPALRASIGAARPAADLSLSGLRRGRGPPSGSGPCPPAGWARPGARAARRARAVGPGSGGWRARPARRPPMRRPNEARRRR